MLGFILFQLSENTTWGLFKENKNVSAPLQNYHSSFARFRKYSEMQVKYPTPAVVGTIFIGAAWLVQPRSGGRMLHFALPINKHATSKGGVIGAMNNVQSFIVFFYDFPEPYGRKQTVYKWTQPLIATPEPLPETGLANQKQWLHAPVKIHAPVTLMLPWHSCYRDSRNSWPIYGGRTTT